jgi:hypothetical protein
MIDSQSQLSLTPEADRSNSIDAAAETISSLLAAHSDAFLGFHHLWHRCGKIQAAYTIHAKSVSLFPWHLVQTDRILQQLFIIIKFFP